MQNIYDNPEFFAGYRQMERFGAGWQRALEQPMFLALLPPVNERRVLDLGCGAGQLTFHLAQQGAAEILGVDVSETMLAIAREERSHPNVTYRRQPIEQLQFPPSRFDLVVSSLAFHYVDDYAALIRSIAGWLNPRTGVLVFSTEHPMYTARLPGPGWVLNEQGDRVGWQIDHYAEEGARQETWFVEGVRKYHRTVAGLLNPLIDAGLRIDRVIEPVPDAERLRLVPRDADERRRPMFILVRASHGAT